MNAWHLTTRSCERKQCVARRGKIGVEDEIALYGNSLNIFHNLQLKTVFRSRSQFSLVC